MSALVMFLVVLLVFGLRGFYRWRLERFERENGAMLTRAWHRHNDRPN